MSDTVSSTVSGVDLPQLASRGDRLKAALIDAVLLFLASVPASLIIANSITHKVSYYGEYTTYDDSQWSIGFLLLATGIIALSAKNVQLLVKGGQTIGKKRIGIHIVDHENRTVPSWFRLIGMRSILPGVLLGITGFILAPESGELRRALTGLLGLISILFIFGENRRCIHDHIAGTVVVDGSPPNKEETEALKKRAEGTANQSTSMASQSTSSTSQGETAPTQSVEPNRPAVSSQSSDSQEPSLSRFRARMKKMDRLYEMGELTPQEYKSVKTRLLDELIEASTVDPEDLLLALLPLKKEGIIGEEEIDTLRKNVTS